MNVLDIKVEATHRQINTGFKGDNYRNDHLPARFVRLHALFQRGRLSESVGVFCAPRAGNPDTEEK